MVESVDMIESLFREKIRIYAELLELLGRERKSVIEKDVDALWQFASRKKAAAKEIETMRYRILEQLDTASVSHGMTLRSFDPAKVVSLLRPDRKSPLRRLAGELRLLKRQVRDSSKANNQYVNEYLSILKDIIGLLADSARPKRAYGRPADRYREQGVNVLFNARI